MQSLILTLHIIVCVLLVILILLQSGKEGMGVIFGGGNSSVFGSAGAGGILAKLTTLMAIIFIITSLSYTYVTSSHPTSESVILDVHIEEPAVPPAGADSKPSVSPAATESKPAAPADEMPPAANSVSPKPEAGSNNAEPDAKTPAEAPGDSANPANK